MVSSFQRSLPGTGRNKGPPPAPHAFLVFVFFLKVIPAIIPDSFIIGYLLYVRKHSRHGRKQDGRGPDF